MRLPRVRFRITPMRHWLRFRLRTLLLAIAALGLLCGAMASVPWVIWRYRVASAIYTAETTGPDRSWSFDLLGSSRREEFGYLVSDRERVVEALFRTLESDTDLQRRVHAAQTVRAILTQPTPYALRRRSLDRAVELATSGRLFAAIEVELAGGIADWASSTGLDTRQRQLILARARISPPDLLPAWARVLAKVGGREETRFLIGHGGTHDAALLNAVHNSPLVRSRWPGLLPAVKRWVDDPEVAPHVLRYSLLSQTSEGRDILLAYATSDRRPMELRRRAVERLQETIPGANLLLMALDDPGTARSLGASLEADPRATLRSALAKLEGHNGDALWSELIDGIDSVHPNSFPSPSTDIEKAVSEAERRIRQSTRESSSRCLRWITGRTDLQSQTDWQRWYEVTRPAPLAQREIVKLVLEHPEALDSGAILRRIVPYHLGTLPDDCVPLYERMAREGPPASRYWACTALLHCTSKTDATPIVIDIIGEQQSVRAGRESWGPIELLKERFAENDFWDVPAWRAWWANHGQEQ